MIHIGEIIDVVKITKIIGSYKIEVLGKNQLNQKFNYTFIKNNKEEVEKLVNGYTWELGCRPFIIE